MTTITGVRGKDFVVLGADSQVTCGNIKLPFNYEKIKIEGDNILIGGSGSVGSLQQISGMVIRTLKSGRAFDDLPLNITVTELVKKLAEVNFMFPLEHKTFSPFNFVVAGMEEDGPALYVVGDDGSVIEVPTYTTEGSGSQIALGILSQKYTEDLDLDSAVKLVSEALTQSSKNDNYTNSHFQILALIYDRKKKDWRIDEFSKIGQ